MVGVGQHGMKGRPALGGDLGPHWSSPSASGERGFLHPRTTGGGEVDRPRPSLMLSSTAHKAGTDPGGDMEP